MLKISYLDFDLLIERMGESYKARIVNSPSGQATSPFTIPITSSELEKFFSLMGRPRNFVRRLESPAIKIAKDIGGRLFNAVFKNEVRSCLERSIDEANRKGSGLRIKLRLSDVPELGDLPWEYLYNPTLNRFLSLSIETPIVRYLELPELIPQLKIELPLRILVMISNPDNYQKLDAEHEWDNLKKALIRLERQKIVEMDRLENSTLTSLEEQLKQKEYHIFHYIGHGGFDKQASDGVLIFEDEKNEGFPVSSQKLGFLLHDHRSIRFVFLNACEGARTSTIDPFAGVAQSLVQQGIPAVIAMQFVISDRAAILLAQKFYKALGNGRPVDASLSEARKEIFMKGNSIEWGTPVLYMRSPDGYIYRIPKRKDKVLRIQKRPLLSTRIFIVLIMLIIPIYLSLSKPKLNIIFDLSTRYIKLKLNYSNPIGKEIKLLENQSIHTHYLNTNGFKPFEISTEISNGKGLKKYKIDPQNNDKNYLELITDSEPFSINSLTYNGLTQLELSVGDAFNSLHFKSVEQSDIPWNVYAGIILPNTYNIRRGECKIFSLSTDAQPILVDELQIKSPLTRTRKLVLENNDKKFDLDLDKENIFTLKNLDLLDFQILRYDYFTNKEVSELITGTYTLLNLNDTSSHKILPQDSIAFKAEKLILCELKVLNKSIVAKIEGKFSSFKICKLDDCDEKIPSKLSKLINSKFGYIISFIYSLLSLLILLWEKIFKRIFSMSKNIMLKE